MSKSFQHHRLDVAAFVQAGEVVDGAESLQKFERIVEYLHAGSPDSLVSWRVQGERRSAVDGSVRPALHLHIAATVPMSCQRCMGEVDEALQIDRHILFANDEATAAALDDESEDDVLEMTAALDLHALIEDELLMALPLVPKHDECPVPVELSAQDAGFDAATDVKPNPFAVLADLKKGEKSD